MIDVAQRRQQEEIEHALAARKKPTIGRTHCANLDCGEPISALRREIGARFCVGCQNAAERPAQSCARTAI